MKNVLAIGRDPNRLVALDQILSDFIDGSVYLGVNEHNLFRGLAQRAYDMLIIDVDAVGDEIRVMVQKIRAKWPRLQIIIVAAAEVEDAAEGLLTVGVDRVIGRQVKRAGWRQLVRALERKTRVA